MSEAPPQYDATSAGRLDTEMLHRNLATLERLGEAVGGWTDKVDARQTGVSMHLRFTNKVDVHTALDFAQVMQSAPAMLSDAIRRLLAIAEATVDTKR